MAQVVVATWVLPAIAMQPGAPKTAFEMFDLAGPLPAFSTVVFAAYVPAGIGLVLLGVATMRAGGCRAGPVCYSSSGQYSISRSWLVRQVSCWSN